MAKFNKTDGISEKEWEEWPVILFVPDVARLFDSTPRYVNDHAQELGGVKRAGKWVFAKRRIAEQLGIA